ncbi:hypothetical protein D3C74_491570 [compost metagenome]
MKSPVNPLNKAEISIAARIVTPLLITDGSLENQCRTVSLKINTRLTNTIDMVPMQAKAYLILDLRRTILRPA